MTNEGYKIASLSDINTEVDSALDTAIPASPTADSINERIKTIDDNLHGGKYTGTVSAGTGTETTIYEIITTNTIEIKSIWLDFVNLTANATIYLHHKIDGTNYRTFETNSWATTDDDGVLIEGFTIDSDFKITVVGGEASGVDITYKIIYQVMQ